VETPGPPPKKPSLFRGGLIGYSVTTLIGTIVCWIIAARSGDFDNQRAFTLLVGFGAPGAFEGYRYATRQRKRLGVNEPSDEWQQFMSSWSFRFLAALVLGGALIISGVESLLFDLVYGAPWLQNR
jgi:hypothetical protein